MSLQPRCYKPHICCGSKRLGLKSFNDTLEYNKVLYKIRQAIEGSDKKAGEGGGLPQPWYLALNIL